MPHRTSSYRLFNTVRHSIPYVRLVVLFISLSAPYLAHSAEFELGAMFAVLSSHLFNPDEPVLFPEHTDTRSSTRLRPFGSIRLSETVFIEAAAQLDLFYDSASHLIPAANQRLLSTWRHPELSRYFRNESGTPRLIGGLVECDRLILHLTPGSTDILIGRQAVNWSGMFFLGPNDLFHPFQVQETERTYKPGVDAIRVIQALGPLTEIELCAVAGYDAYRLDPDQSAAVCRVVSTVSNLHLEAFGGWYQGRQLLGAACQGEIGRMGLRCEGLRFGNGTSEGDSPNVEIASGFDVRSSNAMHLIVEYLYHEAGATHADSYIGDPDGFDDDPGLYLARHYVLAVLDYDIHPLVKLDGSVLWNAVDNSGQLALNSSVSLADDVDLIAGVTRTFGDGPVIGTRPGDVPILLRSEFGIQPSVFHFELRVFF